MGLKRKKVHPKKAAAKMKSPSLLLNPLGSLLSRRKRRVHLMIAAVKKRRKQSLFQKQQNHLRKPLLPKRTKVHLMIVAAKMKQRRSQQQQQRPQLQQQELQREKQSHLQTTPQTLRLLPLRPKRGSLSPPQQLLPKLSPLHHLKNLRQGIQALRMTSPNLHKGRKQPMPLTGESKTMVKLR